MRVPFLSSYRWMQRAAHEYPHLFYSVVIGAAGPVLLITVPPIRERFDYKTGPPLPMSYPIPNRPRRSVQGYED